MRESLLTVHYASNCISKISTEIWHSSFLIEIFFWAVFKIVFRERIAERKRLRTGTVNRMTALTYLNGNVLEKDRHRQGADIASHLSSQACEYGIQRGVKNAIEWCGKGWEVGSMFNLIKLFFFILQYSAINYLVLVWLVAGMTSRGSQENNSTQLIHMLAALFSLMGFWPVQYEGVGFKFISKEVG